MYMELGSIVGSKKNIKDPDIPVFKNIMMPWLFAHWHLRRC